MFHWKAIISWFKGSSSKSDINDERNATHSFEGVKNEGQNMRPFSDNEVKETNFFMSEASDSKAEATIKNPSGSEEKRILFRKAQYFRRKPMKAKPSITNGDKERNILDTQLLQKKELESPSITIKSHFSLKTLEKAFTECLKDPSLNLDSYIQGLSEILNLVKLFGNIFGTVADQNYKKIEIIKKYNTSENKENYTTIERMLNHEKTVGFETLKNNKNGSGSKALLKLHRAFEFIIAFFDSFQTISDEDSLCEVGRNAYEATMKKYHSFLVKKSVMVTMCLLPTKKDFFAKVYASGNPEEIKEFGKDLPGTLDVMKNVYLSTQQLLEDKGLLDIP